MARAWSNLTRQLVEAAVREDLGESGDLTAGLLSDPEQGVCATLGARQAGVIAGMALVPEILKAFASRLSAALDFEPYFADGDAITAGERAAELRGPHAAVLTAERTLLNFLSRLSGVATLTAKFVRAARAANPRVQILDTRKTLPGWRELDKYAVALGGGTNHRFGLHDAVLIKDNHLAGVTTDRLAEHVRELLATLAQLASRPTFIEIEVDSLEQLDAVLPVSEIDYVLLDNFSPEELTEAVRRRDALCSDRKPELEASGNVTLATIAEVAVSGVDRISIGSLTHSVPAFDWGLDL
jgi:nicotinate-nucleotide pyrophosphorylase (carboxylating)